MEKIKIVTDSTADLPLDVVEKYNIEVLPLLVNFGEETYLDGIDIKLPMLLEKVKNGGVFPTTSQVNPQRFYQCYKKYLDEGYNIVSIHLSSKMSGTYQSACIAKEMLETDKIAVIDSLNVTSGLGTLVIKACNLAEKGHDYRSIEMEVVKAVPHVKSVLIFEALDHLVKGGRLSKTAGIIGGMLNIRPILSVSDGEMKVVDKVRGNKKAVRAVLNYIEKIGIKKDEMTMLLQIKNEDLIDVIKNELLEIEKDILTLMCEVGCVVGTHAGPGACGVFFIENYEA